MQNPPWSSAVRGSELRSRRSLRFFLLLLCSSWLIPLGARSIPPEPAASTAVAEGPQCAPLPSQELAPAGPVTECGIAPSVLDEIPTSELIVPLPEVENTPLTPSAQGEAILVLPKDAQGQINTDFVLAPGARVGESFFSPILCSTLARIVGEAGPAPDTLVTELPEGAQVVPNLLYSTAATTIRPLAGDPYRELQYALDAAGIEDARPVTRGAGARIALLDSKPQLDHPELRDVRESQLPGKPAPDPALHGSLMAGVVAAEEGNDFGIAGLAPEADLVAIPVCSDSPGSGTDRCTLYDLLYGFDRALEVEAVLINVSAVGPPSRLLQRAAERLAELGVILVAAAGNEGTDRPRYPAAYPEVLGVGAIDESEQPYVRGNRGPSAQILAPGVEILSTVPGGRFAFGDGTSLAAAHVSGVAALALAVSGDPVAVRAALMAEVEEGHPPPILSPVCDILRRVGHPCPCL